MLEYVFSLWGMVIVGIVCMTIYGVVEILAKQYRKTCDSSIEASLKEEMIKQGRSAEEIERVLRATARPGKQADDS